MISYKVARIVGAGVQLLTAIQQEFSRVAQALNEDNVHTRTVLHSEPAKRVTGMVVYADGTDWNPGAGEGSYEYRSDAAWHKL